MFDFILFQPKMVSTSTISLVDNGSKHTGQHVSPSSLSLGGPSPNNVGRGFTSMATPRGGDGLRSRTLHHTKYLHFSSNNDLISCTGDGFRSRGSGTSCTIGESGMLSTTSPTTLSLDTSDKLVWGTLSVSRRNAPTNGIRIDRNTMMFA